MKLYFENAKGEKRVIAAPRTRDEAIEIIHAFCEERNFKIYYVNSYKTPNGTEVLDVGSHVENFLLED